MAAFYIIITGIALIIAIYLLISWILIPIRLKDIHETLKEILAELKEND